MSHDTAREIWSRVTAPFVRTRKGITLAQFLVYKETYLRDLYVIVDYLETLPIDCTVSMSGPNVGTNVAPGVAADRLLLFPYSRCKEWFSDQRVIAFFLRVERVAVPS